MTPFIFFPGSFLDRILTIFGQISMTVDGSGSEIHEILYFFVRAIFGPKFDDFGSDFNEI